jgi:hypothetical protein
MSRQKWVAIPLFLGTVGLGLFLFARASVVIDVPFLRHELTDNADQDRCLALNCLQPIPPELEVLGNPASLRYPACDQALARTPWDLQAHDGRLYIGLGDDSNEGPTANAGPVPVIVYDSASHRFISEAELPEEQLDRFYRHDDVLWIPGDDPRQSWRWGNVYRREANDAWRKFRTLPGTIHTHTLAWHRGHLFAGLTVEHAMPEHVGQAGWGSAVAQSGDGSHTWRVQPLGGWRILDFLTVRGRLYAVDAFPGPGLQKWLDREQRQTYHAPMYEYIDDPGLFQRRPDLDARVMFPATPQAGQRMALVERAVSFGKGSAYLGVFARKPGDPAVRGAYLAWNLQPGQVMVQRIPLPEGALALDLREEVGTLSVLFAEPLGDSNWHNHVWTTEDGQHWQPAVDFTATAPARSFERLGGDWIFGLSSLEPPKSGECSSAHRAAGTLLRWHSVNLGEANRSVPILPAPVDGHG